MSDGAWQERASNGRKRLAREQVRWASVMHGHIGRWDDVGPLVQVKEWVCTRLKSPAEKCAFEHHDWESG
jgi:hypothetical protein